MPGGGQPNAGTPRPKRSATRRPLVFGLLAGLLVLGAVIGIRYLRNARLYESTDDAFVEAHVVSVSSRVAAAVRRVLVDDNAHVTHGQLLVELDPRDFQARLNQARADLAAARAQHRAQSINVTVVSRTSSGNIDEAAAAVRTARDQAASAHSQVGTAAAERAAAQAEATRAAADADRYQRLVIRGTVSRQQADNAVAANRTARAKLEAARRGEQTAQANLREALSRVAEAEARLRQARAGPDQVALTRAQAREAQAQVARLEAAVRLAELELSYTTIRASTNGRVTRRSVEPGEFVEAGQRLLSVVPDQVWVVANFKETQLAHIRPGQRATITFDAYPDRVFRGHVESIQAGSGAAFSLLPPENATGNFVKVVQRVPVKIVIDDPPDPDHVLGPGMSAVPRVRVR